MHTGYLDHSFSQHTSELFKELGIYLFVNPLSSYPWGGRNRAQAQRQSFERYITPDDVLQAVFIQRKAMSENPSDARWQEPGLAFLNQLMEERSNGQYRFEEDEACKKGPSLLEYAEAEWGKPSWATPEGRRRAMHLVPSPESTAS